MSWIKNTGELFGFPRRAGREIRNSSVEFKPLDYDLAFGRFLGTSCDEKQSRLCFTVGLLSRLERFDSGFDFMGG